MKQNIENKPKILVMINNIKGVREKQNLMQKDISRQMCKVDNSEPIQEQRFGAIERSVNIPSIYTALQISVILKTDITKLYYFVSIDIDTYQKIKYMKNDCGTLVEIEGYKELEKRYADRHLRYTVLLKHFNRFVIINKEIYRKIKVVDTKETDKHNLTRRKHSVKMVLEPRKADDRDKKRYEKLNKSLKKAKNVRDYLEKEIKSMSLDCVLKHGCILEEDWQIIKKTLID